MIRKILQFIGHLEWLRFGIRNRIIRFVHNPETCESEEFIVPFFGGTYRGNFDTYLDWNVYYYGAYAKEELMLFDDFLLTLEEPIVMDVGANVGHHTLFAAMRSKKVLAFEPFLDVTIKLKQKLSENGLSNVFLFEHALGNKNEMATYVKPKGCNTAIGCFVNSGDVGEVIELPIKVGDEVLDELGITDIDFIKIDTEGFEPYVLAGLKKTINRCRPLVFFEWIQWDKNLYKKECENLFPDNYLFYSFIDQTVFFGLFRKPSYKLSQLSDCWPEGNIFAVPSEYIDKLRAQNPTSTAARKLVG